MTYIDAETDFNQTPHVGTQGFSLQAASTRPRHDCFSGGPPIDSSRGRSVSFGPFRLYPAARVVERDGTRLALGSRALDILIVLTERAGEVVSHKELTQRVWRGLVVTPGSLRVHITGLRKALSNGEGKSRYIANVPGQGYCFVAPIRRLDFDGLRGAAGSGKARLAIDVIAETLDGFADGCWIVKFAQLGEPTHVMQTVAIVLGIKKQGSSLLADAAAEHLATRCLALVSDNDAR